MSKILLVDDEPGLLLFIARLIKANGHDALTATDGVEALKIVKETEVDLVLTDLRMPRMDGMTLLREIKALKPTMPVILLTAYASAETELESKKIGAYEYRSKPFNVDKLLDTINNALQERKI